MKSLSLTKRAVRSFLSYTALAVLIALVLALFQYVTSWIETFMELDIEATPLSVTLYGLAILLLSAVEYLLVRPPFYKGNIAALIHLFQRQEPVPVLRGLLLVFFSCLITFLIGLPLGGEGPSVFLGALLGEGLFLWTRNRSHVLESIDIGASTGYAVAFLNPLTGLFNYVERDKANRHPVRLMKASYVLLLSYLLLVAIRYFQGAKDMFHHALFDGAITAMQTGEHNMLLVLVPFLAFFFAIAFKNAVLALKTRKYADKRLLFVLPTLATVLLVLLLRFCGMQELLGIGSNLIHRYKTFTVEDAFLFLVIRFLFTVLAFNFYYAGGQVLPTLAVGYLLGELFAAILSSVTPLSVGETSLFSVVTMLSFYAAVSDNYLTAWGLSFTFGPFEVLALPSFLCIGAVFLLDHHVCNTLSLNKLIVAKDNAIEAFRRSVREQ